MSASQTVFHAQPSWVPRSRLQVGRMPGELRSWLLDQGSLTQRLIQVCSGRFHVEVVQQGWQLPMLNEAQRLGMAQRQQALVRMVLLYCDDQPWVFARTVIPSSTLSGPRRFLSRLGNRPLGAVLFADPTIRRDEMELVKLDRRQALFSMATHRLDSDAECIWGRRSVFHLRGAPLLVSEIFLPGVLSHSCNNK